MLSAAKSFRLALRRASVTKSPKPNGASTENQVVENEREATLLYDKLRHVLQKPRFARVGVMMRVQILERLAKEADPVTKQHYGRDTQSTIASERSVSTYCDDHNGQPESVQSETDVDDLVAASALEAQPEDADLEGYATDYQQRRGASMREPPHAARQKDDIAVSVAPDSGVEESIKCQHTLELPVVLTSADAPPHTSALPKSATVSVATPVEPDVGVDPSAAIAALRTVPFLEACTDEQLIQVFRSEGCVQSQLTSGSEIKLQNNGTDAIVAVVTGTVGICARSCVDLDRGISTPELVRTLSAPTYFNDWAESERLSGERVQLSIRAESAASCLGISEPAIRERLTDISTLLHGYTPRSTDATGSLRRHLSAYVELLQDKTPEQLEFGMSEMDEEIALRRVQRVVEDRLGASTAALFVVNKESKRMMRIRVASGAVTIVYDLPVRGLAGLVSQDGEPICVHSSSTDYRFDAVIDATTTGPLASLPVAFNPHTSFRADLANSAYVFQLAFTNTHPSPTRLSAPDSRLVERVAAQLYGIAVSSCRWNAVPDTTAATERFAIIVSSLCVPTSTLPSLSSSNLHAIVSMKLHHGREELFPATSICSARTVLDEAEGTARFEFLERLEAPEGCSLVSLPPATRVVMEVNISNKLIATSTVPRRRTSMFHGFSSTAATTSSMQFKTSTTSSASMSQTLTEPDDAPFPADSFKTTAIKSGRETVLSGWSGFFLYQRTGTQTTGDIYLNLWTDYKKTPVPMRQSGLQNPDSRCVLHLNLRADNEAFVHSSIPTSAASSAIVGESVNDVGAGPTPASWMERLLRDPLYEPTANERGQLWGLRLCQPFDSRLLTAFLISVDWKNPVDVAEVHQLLDNIDLLEPPELALRLLGPRFPDPRIRAYAVRCLENVAQPLDAGLYLLQLVHALQHERFDDSPLARFLLRKALQFPHTIGHQFYWLLKTNMHHLDIRERYGTLLDVFLTHTSATDRLELRHQIQVMKQLEETHTEVAQYSAMEDKQAALVKALGNMSLPSEFVLPLDPARRLCGISINECRVLGSKKKPLYLVFRVVGTADASVSPPSFHVIYKCGDDLRQDQLVLQLFRVMNRVWSACLKDSMQLISYGCVSTGPNEGMIEVVRDAETIGSIFSQKAQREYGSERGSTQHKLRSALSVLTEQDALTEWLLLHSLPPYSLHRQKTFQKLHRASLSGRLSGSQVSQPDARDLVIERLRHSNRDRLYYEDAVRNFATSCAASCIASYVLGIGDRHNDNIMVSRQGRLFHIDFGHILGNFKKKFGVKRERTMFVFTPAFAAVLMSASDRVASQDTKRCSSPRTGPQDVDQTERETSFLKHLKHTRSCHLEPLAIVDDVQEKTAELSVASTAGTTVADGPLAMRRKQWQRSIHSSLRMSVPQASVTASGTSTQTLKNVPAYELFTRLCCDGYNVVRHHAALLLDLGILMTGGSLPELQHESDLEWLRTQLLLDETDERASDHFLKLIKHSVISRATLLNDAAHMIKHG